MADGLNVKKPIEDLLARHCRTMDEYLRELSLAVALGSVEHAMCLKYGILPTELIGGLLTARKTN